MLKQYITAVAFIGMVGCASIPFDSQEYSMMVNMHTTATQGRSVCIDSPAMIENVIMVLEDQSANLLTYSKFLDSRNHMYKSVKHINELIEELIVSYTAPEGEDFTWIESPDYPSNEYCVNKMENITYSIELVLSTMAGKE